MIFYVIFDLFNRAVMRHKWNVHLSLVLLDLLRIKCVFQSVDELATENKPGKLNEPLIQNLDELVNISIFFMNLLRDLL